MATTLAHIQQRRKTAAAWTSSNEVLLASEIGVETDTGKWKLGDGATVWNSLGYQPNTAALSATYLTQAAASATSGYVGRGSQMLTPDDFGAKGDGRTVVDATFPSSTTVASSTAAFTSADVGKLIVVLPAVGSGQATFASTITAVNSSTNVTVAATTTRTGSGPYEATIATNDTTALQSWFADTRTVTRYLPGRIYGFTAALVLCANSSYDVLCATGGVLKVMGQIATPGSWPAGARAVPTAVYTPHATLISSQRWSGGVIDTSNLCMDGFAPKWLRSYTVDTLKVRGGGGLGCAFHFGDDSIAGTSTSYQITVQACLAWRDFGSVPRGSTALNPGTSLGTGTLAASTDTVTITSHGLTNGQGVVLSALTGGAGITAGTNFYVANATTNTFTLVTSTNTAIDITTDGSATVLAYGLIGSTGLRFALSSSDSAVTGKTSMQGYQVGYENHGYNINYGPGVHAWSRPTIGLMDYGFDDYNGGSKYTATYADTPQLAGYRMRSINPSHFIGAEIFNNGSFGGTDNVIAGFVLDSPRVGHSLVAPVLIGSDGSHRIAYPVSLPAWANVVPSHPFTAPSFTNVTNPVTETVPSKGLQSYTGSTTLFTSEHGYVVQVGGTTAANFTINTATFTAGQSCEVVQTGTGQITFVAGGGVTILSRGGLLHTIGQYSRVVITCLNNSNTYLLAGDLA